MLRGFVLLLGLALVVFGVVLAVVLPGGARFASLEPGILGALVLAGFLFERRYRNRVDRSRPTWQPTGEKFIDPASGVLTEVFYDPTTGERDYRNVQAP